MGAISRSVFNRFKSAAQGGQVLRPAIAKIGRPLAAEICFAASKLEAALLLEVEASLDSS